MLTEKEQLARTRLQKEKPLVFNKVMKFDDNMLINKSIAIIQLQYSYACNFQCSHCSVATFRKENQNKLNIPTVKRVMDEAHNYGLAHIGISGGEPLVFKDLTELIEAIGPKRFHIQVDTNGWNMTPDLAVYLKSLGVDKIQVSIDGMDAETHDAFRRKTGSHARALAAVEHIQKAGLQCQVATVVDHERAMSNELLEFMKLIQSKNAAISVVYAKALGEWSGRTDLLCTPEDIAHVKKLLREHGGYDHTTPGYGKNLGCIAVKRMISLTANGDVLPCPWMHWSLGNVFDSPLGEILDKGMCYFGEHFPVCRLSESKEFNEMYTSKVKPGKLLSVEQIMGEQPSKRPTGSSGKAADV